MSSPRQSEHCHHKTGLRSTTVEVIATAAYVGFKRWGIDTSTIAPINTYARYPDDHTTEAMIQRSWCPSEIVAVRAKFVSLQTRFFLSCLEKKSPDGVRKKHDSCTEQHCKSFQIDPKDHCIKHQCKHQVCDMLMIDGEVLQSTLRRGQLPLLDIMGSGELLKVNVVESEPSAAYTAISHVWADGLGNPAENSLPKCQLERIRDLAAVLNADPATEKRGTDNRSTPFGKNSTRKLDSLLQTSIGTAVSLEPAPMLFWIDTLCCPVRLDQAKDLALKRMAETYSKAAHVLALDVELQVVRQQQIQPYEALLRVFSSAWVQRLWTSQEGALARRLWIQFGDGPVEVSALVSQLEKDVIRDIRIYCMSRDLLNQWLWLNIMHPADQQMQVDSLGARMTNLDSALEHRSTSVAADEPLCIATLIGISVEEVLKAGYDVEVRMAKVWELIAKKYGKIPQRILSLSYPRLTVKGFQWAPRTLLREVSNKIWNTRPARWMSQKFGILSEQGLELTAPG